MGLQTARMSLPDGAELTRAEDFEIRQLKGSLTGRVLERVVRSALYQRLPDDARRNVLERAIERTREAVTKEAKRKVLGRVLNELKARANRR